MQRFIRKAKIPDVIPVLVDDREKRPLILPSDRFRVTRKRFLTGDYTFAGLEEIVAIERKHGLDEIVSNLSMSNRPRFVAMLRRLSAFPVRLMLVEGNGPHDVFSLIDYRTGETTSTIKTLTYWLSAISLTYGIPVVYVTPLVSHGFIEQLFADAYAAGIRWCNSGKRIV